MSHYVSARPEAKFHRRRCPGCGAGLFSKRVDIPATHRKCEGCGLVFHLEREGVRPGAQAIPKTAPASSPPIAGGAYAIAGAREIRGFVWRGKFYGDAW